MKPPRVHWVCGELRGVEPYARTCGRARGGVWAVDSPQLTALPANHFVAVDTNYAGDSNREPARG